MGEEMRSRTSRTTLLNVDALCSLPAFQVEAMKGQVDDAVFRRARHVVTENDRTVAAAQALKKADYAAVGRLMVESHQSLREVFFSDRGLIGAICLSAICPVPRC